MQFHLSCHQFILLKQNTRNMSLHSRTQSIKPDMKKQIFHCKVGANTNEI